MKSVSIEGARLTALVLMTTGVLTACGGGGGSGSSTTPPTAVSSDAIDPYLGTYISTCQQDGHVVDAATSAALYRRDTFTVQDKQSATRAAIVAKLEYFDASTCSGTVRATINLAGSDNYVVVDGSTVVAGKTAQRVTVGTGVYFPGFSFGTSLTLNGVRFSGVPYNLTTPQTAKALYLLDGNDLFAGDDTTAGVGGYPTALLAAKFATKQ